MVTLVIPGINPLTRLLRPPGTPSTEHKSGALVGLRVRKQVNGNSGYPNLFLAPHLTSTL